ncbi:MAG: CHAP domain-containing protein, partial [Bacteroidota bacterium]
MKYLFFIIFLCALLTNNYGQSYPWANDSENEADDYCFYKRNCTSYCGFIINESLNYHYTNDVCSEDFPLRNNLPIGDILSHAHNWNEQFESLGFEVNNIPKVGAIAFWEAYDGLAGEYGHVAMVDH